MNSEEFSTMKPPPPLTYVRSFECAARHLSFTAAGKELGYTQAAVSSHIRALEQYIGRKLFVRYARSLRLTDIGEAFLPTLRQSLDQIDHATESILASVRNKTVVVACPMSLAENWLAECIAAFHRKHPGIEIVLHGTVWENSPDPVADVTIVTRRYDDRPASGILLWNDSLILLCAPKLLEGPTGVKEPQDILRLNCIFVHGRQEYWRHIGAALNIDTSNFAKTLTTNASNIALELATMGAGCVATQASLARTYVKRGLLVEPFAVRPISPWAYYLVDSPVSKGAVVKTVRDWIFARAEADFGLPSQR
jgi:LysR family glycine cleavage system transcriptional activator